MSEVLHKNIPESIQNKILELKNLEIRLGHLPSVTWTVNELQNRMEDSLYKDSLEQMEVGTEKLFAEICDELLQHQFTYLEIASAINSVLTKESGLKYCNEIEVKEALGVEE